MANGVTTQTIDPIPTAASDFLEVLQAFLRDEDAKRFALQFHGFVVEGGIHGTVAGLTATPDPLTAFPGGYYITETGAITYADDAVTWVIADKDTTGNLTGFTRVPGTHYLVAVGSNPALPDDAVRLMAVTTAAGAITVVVDQRQLSPLVNKTLMPYLRLIGTEPSARDLRLSEESGQFAISSNAGTEDQPAWSLLFLLSLGQEALTLVNNATVPRTQQFQDQDGTIALLSDIAPPNVWVTGDFKWSATNTPQTGWLLCDGSAVSRLTYATLFGVVGESFGPGNGSTTFNLPDGRNRFFLMAGTGHNVGDTGGAESHVLTQSELPQAQVLASSPASVNNFVLTVPDGEGDGDLAGTSVKNLKISDTSAYVNGSVQAHPNMPPFVVGGFLFIRT